MRQKLSKDTAAATQESLAWCRHHCGSDRRDDFRAGRGVAFPRRQRRKPRPRSQYIEFVNGQVVAFSRGKPVLLEALDTVSERTRPRPSDQQRSAYLPSANAPGADSQRARTGFEFRYGVAAEGGQAIAGSKASCAEPIVSQHQGGLVSRGVASR